MATGALAVGSHQQDVFVDLTAVALRIVGQAGEAPGSAVRVSFRGDASALHDFSGLVDGAYLGLGLSVSRDATVVGEYLWDVQQTGDESVGFSFGANVGDEYTLSAYMLSGGGLSGAEFVPSGATSFALIDSGASLNGSFSVTAVPDSRTGAWDLCLATCGARRARLPAAAPQGGPLRAASLGCASRRPQRLWSSRRGCI